MAETKSGAISLFDEFSRGTAFEAALVTTYNLYFPFLEELVLRQLRSLGCTYVVALADAAQVAADLAAATRRPHSAGRRYALLPVAAAGAFHPKIGLFLGPRSARVIVGSHNLTMSGFAANREVTNVIDVQGKQDREGAAAVQEALGFCQDWAEKLSPSLRRSLDDFAKFARLYQGPVPTDRRVAIVGSRPNGASLWERVLPHMPSSADRITVVGPFFDGQLAFLQRLRDDLSPQEIVVGLDPDTVSFPREATLPPGMRLVDAAGLSSGEKRGGYLHAKAILIESGDERILISGSANPTFAAWLAPPQSRNAEMMVVRRLEADDHDLGLGALAHSGEVAASSIQVSVRREEPMASSGSEPRPLVGYASGTSVAVELPPDGVESARLISAEGEAHVVTFEYLESTLVLTGSAAADSALFVLSVGSVDHYGWVHHAELLRRLAISSSQRQIRDALSDGLTGDPTALEQLMKIVEKAIFREVSIDIGRGHGGHRQSDDDAPENGNAKESSVAIVPTLKTESGEGLRRISSGDLGLLLDLLMRQLWRSLTHERSFSGPIEGELVDSEDEGLVAELPVEPRVAEAWRKKTATLLRRLMRLVKESEDRAQVIVQCAAVLGVLEAVRRVEDQDQWKRINAEFLDREVAKSFLFEAAPALLRSVDGVLDASVVETGEDFAECEALIRWLAWLCWVVGFGLTELAADLTKAAPPDESIRALTTMGLIATRLAGWPSDDPRILEALEASPRAGIQSDIWLADLLQLGETMAHPECAERSERAPVPGDLVWVKLPGKPPLFVREARGKNVELVDVSRPDLKLIIRADRVEVLQILRSAKMRARAV